MKCRKQLLMVVYLRCLSVTLISISGGQSVCVMAAAALVLSTGETWALVAPLAPPSNPIFDDIPLVVEDSYQSDRKLQLLQLN